MFSIIQWNINGYFNNYIHLEILINSYSPAIILLSETHLPHNYAPHTPRKYIGYFHNLPSINTNKQGTAILIRRNIPHKQISIVSNVSSIALEVDLPKKIGIVGLYIHPTQRIVSSDILGIIKQLPSDLIMGGDFNAWSTIWGSAYTNSRGECIEDVLMSSNLICLNDGSATHFSTRNSFTTVDLTLCSASIAPLCSWQVSNSLHGSDHYPITIQLNAQTQSTFKSNAKFILESADWAKFSTKCINLCETLRASSNVNQEAANISKIIRIAAHHAIPQTSPKSSKKRIPWWNSQLSQLRENKQNKRHEYKRFRTISNLVSYKKANALFKRAAKNAKRKKFEELTASINPNTKPRKIWHDIKMLTGSGKQTTFAHINSTNGVISSPLEIANYFASFYASNSNDASFSSNFCSAKYNCLNDQANIINNLSPAARTIESKITINELEFALSTVKGKTPGLDRISYPMIQNLPSCMKYRLTNLYNQILNYGFYPQAWKTSYIVPILKPNKPPTSVESYRPISLLSCLGKLMEKLVANRLMWYIKNNKVISSNQVAYKKGSGTIDALLHLDYVVTNALSSRNHVSLLAIDLEKAFDRIGVHIILKQLTKLKVGSKIINFVKSFLTNRKCRVRINGFASIIVNLENGTPQGSPLSALLFIIAFDEIAKLSANYPSIECQLYADDVFFFTKNANLLSVSRIFESILRDIMTWSSTSGTSISFEKSKTLHICKKSSCSGLPTQFFGHSIMPVKEIKILGVIIDSKYKFKKHCKYIKDCIMTRLNIIKYLSSKKSFVHPSSLVHACRALILSKIDYGLPIYGNADKRSISQISSPYHSAIRRSIRAFPTTPLRNLFAETGLPKIPDRIEDSTHKLLPKLLFTYNVNLIKDFRNASLRKRRPKITSVVAKCLSLQRRLELPGTLRYRTAETQPPWTIRNIPFAINTLQRPKEHTAKEIYKALFTSEKEKYSKQGWNFIFTDGSKTQTSTSFAVTKENGDTIKHGFLHPICSAFTAETAALLEASIYAKQIKGKIIICTDSQSCINAIGCPTHDQTHINTIRNILISYPNKIKLMWVPGHSGITGNENADAAARSVSNLPSMLHKYYSKSDILLEITKQRRIYLLDNWKNYQHHYAFLNPSRSKISLPSDLPLKVLKPYSRLRLGHTILTHAHLLQRTLPADCPFCDETATLDHILQSCRNLHTSRHQFFGSSPALDFLKEPSASNILTVYKFLKANDLLRRI